MYVQLLFSERDLPLEDAIGAVGRVQMTKPAICLMTSMCAVGVRAGRGQARQAWAGQG